MFFNNLLYIQKTFKDLLKKLSVPLKTYFKKCTKVLKLFGINKLKKRTSNINLVLLMFLILDKQLKENHAVKELKYKAIMSWVLLGPILTPV